MGVNMNNRKILNFITPNVNDKFSWMELNCTYRPVANILKCYEKEYYSYYLMISSFLDIYFYKDNGGRKDIILLNIIMITCDCYLELTLIKKVYRQNMILFFD